jgi:hypothetical protein
MLAAVVAEAEASSMRLVVNALAPVWQELALQQVQVALLMQLAEIFQHRLACSWQTQLYRFCL